MCGDNTMFNEPGAYKKDKNEKNHSKNGIIGNNNEPGAYKRVNNNSKKRKIGNNAQQKLRDEKLFAESFGPSSTFSGSKNNYTNPNNIIKMKKLNYNHQFSQTSNIRKTPIIYNKYFSGGGQKRSKLRSHRTKKRRSSK
jgi:hypothetical protein